MKRRSFITALLGIGAGASALPAIAVGAGPHPTECAASADTLGVSGGITVVYGVLRSADGSIEIDFDRGGISFHSPVMARTAPLLESA